MGKNFGTTISPWVVTMDALEQFTVPNMELRNPILDYLKHDDEYNFDIKLQGIDCITFQKKMYINNRSKVCQPISGRDFWMCIFLDSMQFIKVAIKGENMEEYKHVADSNFKVSGIIGPFF